MTVSLAYDDTNARVLIEATGLGDAPKATVERSTNQIKWTTVRGGAEVDVEPIGLVLPGAAGDYASTPDAAALDITGDIDLRADATLDNWTGGGAIQTLVGKWVPTGDQRSYRLCIDSSGMLSFQWSTDGASSSSVAATQAIPTTLGGRLAVRATLDVDNGASGNTVTFYTASTIDGSFTQLGDPVVTAGTTSVFASTAGAEVGSADGGTIDLATGIVHAVEIRDGIDGTVVADPRFDEQPEGTTSFVDDAGRTWTLNGDAEIVDLQLSLVDYEFSPGVLNYYRVTAVPTGLYLPGGAGNYASTPDTAVLDITGDIDLRADFTLSDWSFDGVRTLVGKYDASSNERAYRLTLLVGGFAQFQWSTTGANFISAISTVPLADLVDAHGRLALRCTFDVDDGAGGRVAKFYVAPTIEGPWTLLDTVTGSSTSIYSSAADLEVGTSDQGVGALFPGGVIHAVEVRDGIDGTIVANPNFEVQDYGDTSFIDDAGRTWTINGNAFISTAQTASITPDLTQVWIKSVTRPFLNRPASGSCTAIADSELEILAPDTSVVRRTRPAVHAIINRTFPVATTDVALARNWMMRLRTHTYEAFKTLDYLLASGDVLFIQVPAGCPDQTIEHGYVVAYDPSYTRHTRHRNRVVWDIIVQEVAPPGPDIAYAEVTWQTVLNLYATWADLIAANPTWADVLALLPDPSEVIVA